MSHRFKRHYTREEANALLPDIRQWLRKLKQSQQELGKHEKRLSGMMATGEDVGGDLVNQWVHAMADIKDVLSEFLTREILLKDAERGLIDFPSIIGDKEVFLCWEQDEKSVEFWHDLESGYANREKL
jgi:hypothetical protein